MEVNEVKENLGKDVLFRLPDSKTESEFTLNAYIFRIDPRNPQKRLSQLELQDKNCSHSVVIAGIEIKKNLDTQMFVKPEKGLRKNSN